MKHRILAAIAALGLVACLPAQNDFPTLRRELDAARDAMVKAAKGRPSLDDVKQLARTAATRLQSFVAEHSGDDAINARLMLANVWLEVGDLDKVKSTLSAFDAASTPPMALAAAAELASRAGADADRERFVAAAVAAKAPFEQRMALAVFLATRLVEIERSDAIFAAAAKEAKGDEESARVAWYRVTCMRAREDLEEDAWIRALDDLATAWPSTYWGGIAKDLKTALDLKSGDPAITFKGRTLDDKPIALSDFTGKVVLLEFWESHTDRAASFLATLRDQLGERGFELIGIAAFDDVDLAKSAVKSSGRTWPQVFDGKGLQNDVALRYGIERLPDFVLIDRKGRIAMLHPFLDDAGGRADLRDTIVSCLDRD